MNKLRNVFTFAVIHNLNLQHLQPNWGYNLHRNNVFELHCSVHFAKLV